MSGASSEAAVLLPMIFTFIIVFAVKFIRNQIHEDSIKKGTVQPVCAVVLRIQQFFRGHRLFHSALLLFKKLFIFVVFLFSRQAWRLDVWLLSGDDPVMISLKPC